MNTWMTHQFVQRICVPSITMLENNIEERKKMKAQLLQILQLNKLLAILINTQNQCKAKTYQTIILQHIQLISKRPTN